MAGRCVQPVATLAGQLAGAPERAARRFLYDTASFVPSTSTITRDEVQANLFGITHTETGSVPQRVRERHRAHPLDDQLR
jgi:hypothetical protein